MKKLLAFILFLFAIVANSQVIIPAITNNGGGTFTNAQYQLDYSIGQTSIQSYTVGGSQINEGVLQPLRTTCTTPSLIILGQSSVCPGQSGFYSILSPTVGSTYNWSIIDANSVISSGQGKSNVFIKFGTFLNTQIVVSETTKGGCVGSNYYLSISSSSGSYSIPNVSLSCGTTNFVLPITTLSTLSSGIISLDLCINYDPSVITATGVATLGNVVLGYGNGAVSSFFDYSSLGQINASLYLNSSAPANSSFGTLGTVVSFSFSRRSGLVPGSASSVNFCQIIEGYSSGVAYQCGNNGTVSVSNNLVSGVVNYTFGTAIRPLRYNSASPATYNVTNIISTDVNCQNMGYSTVPDINGNFVFNTDHGLKIQLKRDIPGSYYNLASSQNVVSVINSADALAISQASATRSWTKVNGNPSVLITAYPMDVNLDGLVTSQDAALVSRRSVLQLPEYPQEWNYTNGIPNNTVDISKDWIFADRSWINNTATTLSIISFLPTIPDCLDEPVVDPSSCSPAPLKEYLAFLLGDVNGSWNNPVNPTLLRSSGENQLIVALDESVPITGGFSVPIYLNGVANSVDFYFDFDSTQSSFTKVVPTVESPEISYIWNNFLNRTLLSGAYSPSVFDASSILYTLNVLTNSPLSTNAFKNSHAFINGNEVPVSFRVSSITAVQNNLKDDYFRLYPNPTSGKFLFNSTVNVSNVEVTILTATGDQILKEQVYQSNGFLSKEFDLNGFNSGIYVVKISGDGFSKVVKLVKQ